MDQQVKRVKRELVKNGAILDIYTDTMQLPDGKLEEWDFISHRKGAAAVVPVRGDGKILTAAVPSNQSEAKSELPLMLASIP